MSLFLSTSLLLHEFAVIKQIQSRRFPLSLKNRVLARMEPVN